ncbi:molybdenum cofactor guanylyltransferase [Paenibacillus sp. PK3_47]|uniref:molybdenum cofactor guanylyltransferase n=1 Tax=Paenibacillus sp. PK3_47 TaxID=2072642 RepID=UPI00201D86AA|nr:molybdenum cofactor guanylyltransferase [Paenibacillus sp. PK3_47]UQZ33913.1 molybdenum cofactor guanylyltransferase [Paenibacillus sp. PK3_47]
MTGVILAGGRSRRMGADKALLKLAGIPLISHSAELLSQLADPVLIACGGAEREEYRFLNLTMVPDRYPGQGPLAGLHAALQESRTAWTAALACDLPLAPGALFRYMAELAAACPAGPNTLQAIVPVNAAGKVQPLLALYHHSVLPDLDRALQTGHLRVMDWLAGLAVHYVRAEEYPGDFRAFEAGLLNMNTPDDYEAASLLHGGSQTSDQQAP